MSRFDDRLTKELERAARPAEPAGVFDEIDRRRERRVTVRRVQTAMLATVVFAGSIGGVLVLNRAFRGDGGRTSIDQVSPFPTTPKSNGLIAFADGSQVFTVPPEGGDPTPLPGAPNGAWHPAWSPDGTRIAVTAFQEERSIWVLNADGSDAQQIATADSVSRPSWSPDGTQIAYAANTVQGSTIHVVNADGSGDHTVGSTLTGRDYFSVSFSPDGTKLLYDAGTDVGFGIFVMSVDGTGAQEIGATGHDYDPSWSPDGREVLFTRQEQGAESDIWIMDADGTHVRQLTNDGPGVTNLDPIFSPDGTKVAYMAGVTGGPGALVVMDPDGSDPVTVVRKDVIGLSWQPVDAGATDTPMIPDSGDIGLGFLVCNVETLHADLLGDGRVLTAWVATRRDEAGGCPTVEEGPNFLAADFDGDGMADTSIGPISCELECRPAGTSDLDADATPELFVMQIGGVTPSFHVYRLEPPDAIQPVIVLRPADPAGGFEPAREASLSIGGDGFSAASFSCQDGTDGRSLISSVANQEPPDSVDAVWKVHETTLRFIRGGAFEVVGSRDYQSVEYPFPDMPSLPGGHINLCGDKVS